jgi:hypothetical protein
MCGTVGSEYTSSRQRTGPLLGFLRAPLPGACTIAGSDPGPHRETRCRPSAFYVEAHLGDQPCRCTATTLRVCWLQLT